MEALAALGHPPEKGRRLEADTLPLLPVLEPADRLGNKEIRARIDAAIQRLSPDHREVIILREIDGLEYREIADRVGIPLGSVMSRLFYARKKLQTLLRDVYETL